MGALHDLIQDREKRRAVVDDGASAIDAEVATKRGFSGKMVQMAFKVVRGVSPGFIPGALDHLLDDFALQVDPYYDDWKALGDGAPTLGSYFQSRGAEIAEDLLSITDSRAKTARNKVVKKAYTKLRPQAVQHTVSAMPRVATLLQRHVEE